MIYSTSRHLVALFCNVELITSNTILFKNIQEYSKKNGSILKALMSSIFWSYPKNDIYMFSEPQKILGIQSICKTVILVPIKKVEQLY